MSPTAVGLLGIFFLFFLMIFRTPVAFAMLLAGFFGMWVLQGLRTAGALMLTESYSAVASETLIVVPMFVLLGNIASAAGFSRGLYDAAFAWVGHFRGGLASASVLGCAAFSAVSGSSVATAVTIGKVALPEMKRLGYADGLATGAVAAGGTLGFLIPPSTGFVLYAILTEQSIGRLFMAGILPGLLLMVLFMLTVWLVALRKPDQAPAGPNVPIRQRFATLKQAGPLMAVMVLTIGGIYIGAFTPVEASGIGAALVILLALAGRKLNRAGFAAAVMDTLKTTAMLYMIVIGANVLNPFFAVTQIPALLGEGLQGLGLGPYGTLFAIIIAYVIMGMFMDGLSMLVISVPIVFPVITALGFDPIWFGVVAVIVVEMGMITPPVGLNVFVVRGVAGDVSLKTVFRGVMPFLFAMIVGLLLIILFPQIALIIPNTMFG
ncbi:TRAP transporter large permease [Aliirhizobium cellulosilyticum]|uniref:TRAP transporter large permease protein n=1 Tax=Aliirhizobium cellulosilyticum TaxID=393664 RepID=A0A7W6TKB0_9HYPH|nr:TRAP transporter large permease [Rhizobium cellulosilyticum]MBB4351625.1 tripartite ATP-independent transporter DctM subunit [Rhizobium cellulosilyticum]MBB4414877.1 tripartite ATP-independent transporter DctM subunit [Rhizobium cellulosilyticum]MBB4449551.1 tripartite ATP-independent transporter DctM subunit [Rhizobium cellulosilyticum]